MNQAISDMDLNTEILHDLLSKGTPKKHVAQELGISVHALNRTITELTESQGLLLKYKELQNLQLTSLQAKVLAAITPEKIESASLIELVSAFRVLKDKELVITGKANNITGIVGYLIELEKEEMRRLEGTVTTVECETVLDTEFENDLPKL
jgi:hypothetical protein